MGQDAKIPFARQMWMGYTLLGEWCPRCSNPKWAKITGVPVNFKVRDMPEHVQFLENGKCPKCKVTKSELIKKGYLNQYDELDACIGQRGGKTAFSSTLSAYLIHVFLKIPRLSKICDGIKEDTPITGTFVSIRFTDAIQLLWTPILSIIDNSPFFQEYHKLLTYTGEKLGKELFKKKDLYIRYAHKNIELYPSGPTKRGLRGRTRFLGVIDELGWFPINKKASVDDTPSDSGDRERADAEEVHIAIDRSLLTVRTEVGELIEKKGYNTIPTGLQICVSSPTSRMDKIWRLSQAAKSSKTKLGVNLPTWEMSPRYTRQNKIIAEAYRTNPVIAERDYGANPPMAASPFIEDKGIKNCFSGVNRVLVEMHEKEINGKNFIAAKVSKLNVPNSMPPSVLAIDAGYCLAGSTLVSTEFGLLSIKAFKEEGKSQKNQKCKLLDIKVSGRDSPVIAKSWHYNGIKQTYKVKTKSGHRSIATANHEHLVLRNGEHVSIQLKNLKLGDLLCFNLRQVLRKSKLKLNLLDRGRIAFSNNTSGVHGVYKSKHKNRWSVTIFIEGKRCNFGAYLLYDDAVKVRNILAKKYGLDNKVTSQKSITKPKYMTPELAFIVGALISEGYFGKYATNIANTNLKFLDTLRKYYKKVFDVDTSISKGRTPIKFYNINGVEGVSEKPCYSLSVYSSVLSAWWVQLGLLGSKKYGRRSSYYKTIPDCILQADYRSQAAFIAAYFEGDGSIGRDRRTASVWSVSVKLLHQMQILLNAHGVMSYIRKGCLSTASSHDYDVLYALVEPYLTHKKNTTNNKPRNKISNKYGFSSAYFKEFLKSRQVHHNKYGMHYTCDDGTTLVISRNKLARQNLGPRFLYEAYDKFGYSTFLHILKKVSSLEYTKLKKLLDCRYSYSEITSIEKYKKIAVYDLSIEGGRPPFFVANGMVVHNSGNSFALAIGTMMNNKIVVPALIEVQPESGSVIHYNAMYKGVIEPIIKAFNVQFMFADRWQSISMLHRAQSELKIQAFMYSAKMNDFNLTRSKMQDIDIQFPKIEKDITDDMAILNYPAAFKKCPAAHLYFQAMTVKDAGRTVLKGDGYTDDLFRAVVLLVSRLHDPKIKEQLEKMTVKNRLSQVVGVVRGTSYQQASEFTIKPVAGFVMRKLMP